MKSRGLRVCLALWACACAGLVVADPPLPETPAAAHELLYARDFVVTAGFPFTWSAERPRVESGTLVVIEVSPELLRPRQTAEPVLYVGAHSAWRVSSYNDAGIVVAFVPVQVDLADSPVWFGTPELPERVDTTTALRELQLARAAGIGAFGEAAVSAAGGRRAAVTFADRTALLQGLHELVLEYVPR
jgi:hypothetical protein